MSNNDKIYDDTLVEYYKSTYNYLASNRDSFKFCVVTNFTMHHLFCTRDDRVTSMYTKLGYKHYEEQATAEPCPQCGLKTIWIKDLQGPRGSTDRFWNLSHTLFNNKLMLIYTCDKCNEKDRKLCKSFSITCFNGGCTYTVDRISFKKAFIKRALVLLVDLPVKIRT